MPEGARRIRTRMTGADLTCCASEGEIHFVIRRGGRRYVSYSPAT